MKFLRVEYRDSTYDYVPAWMLCDPAKCSKIKRFFRPGENRWVMLGVDRVRGGQSLHETGNRGDPV
jgi:hypothetical protein